MSTPNIRIEAEKDFKLDHFKIVKTPEDSTDHTSANHFTSRVSMHSGEWDYFRYSYCGAVILIGFVVNLVVIGRVFYDRRRGWIRRVISVNEISNGFYLSFTILTCFVASSNLILLITRDLGHLLETATAGDWRSTNFVCKLYKFSSFLAYHLCSYSVLAMVACTSWYVCRGKRSVPKQNRIGMLVAVSWALAVAFCAPLYHVSGLADEDKMANSNGDGKRRLCYTIRPHDPNNTDVVFAYYPYFLIATILIVPSLAIVICYLLSAKKILAQRRAPESPVNSVRLVQYVPQTPGHRDEIDEFSSQGSLSTAKIQRSRTPATAKETTQTEESETHPPKPERRTKLVVVKKEKTPLTTGQRENEISEHADAMAQRNGRSQANSPWKICRIAAIIALTYAVCWLPYAIVYLLVARGDVDPDTLSITIPTYMLFLLYPIVSGVCLIV